MYSKTKTIQRQIQITKSLCFYGFFSVMCLIIVNNEEDRWIRLLFGIGAVFGSAMMLFNLQEN